MKKKRALLSVSNKNGIIEFASQLLNLGFEILSTGGTLEYLTKHGVFATSVSEITNFPEILDGRVKTLHPKIHGGLLAKRDDKKHISQMEEYGIANIELLCVNLYPFAETINKPGCQLEDAIENIDIGGPAMIRAASKNYKHVIVITDPKDYTSVLESIQVGEIGIEIRMKLAQKAFSHTAYYDSLISNYLARNCSSEIGFSQEFTIPLKLSQKLRYGENGHQQAAFYIDNGNINGMLSSFKQLQGKELSYNNLVDTDTAFECVKQFEGYNACVIVKHANPCGVALGATLYDSYKKAVASDPVSSFGGIVALNHHVDKTLAIEIAKHFIEVLIAPSYSEEALEVLSAKVNVRVLKAEFCANENLFDYKRIGGGMLIQTPENKTLNQNELKVVSQLNPDANTLNDLEFAWKVARYVKSNAIVLVKDKQTIGIGAGQMSRVDSTKIALSKANEYGFDSVGSVCASDAFFPFRDNVDLLGKSGIKAIIHPGGSIKDTEVFEAADEHGVIMVLTGYRTFRH